MPDLEKRPVKFIISGIGEAEGELFRHKAPHSVRETWYSLPLTGRVMPYEDVGLYFLVNYQVKLENAVAKVEAGDIAYSPMNKGLYVFWDAAEPYSEVNVIGKITQNLDLFKDVKKLARITLERRE
ncbi:MAG: hypothetical protein GF308_16260 [Candidatus Heimdallarchaeota archaeon]|nr:hypothetical protein [Candidatus Heimdallarchaeota archaeon]